MKIAVLGTRGIPNNYGGFEQFAELASAIFVKHEHEVVVYNPSDHPCGADTFAGIRIERMLSREKMLGFMNTFLFDYLCLRHADREGFDVILALGYHPAALFYSLKKSGAVLITNMAGMEWQRSKWNAIAKKLIRHCEKLAVARSDAIVADNAAIASYFARTYGINAAQIAYGAVLPGAPSPHCLVRHELRERAYLLLIARFQPDNNLEMILDGYLASGSTEAFLVIGNCTNSYGRALQRKYAGKPLIRFTGPLYDYQELSSLRHYARLYFHGHSCGGTNPSLLEAMASGAFIVAHDNAFNRSVVGDDGLYFATSDEVALHIAHAEVSRRDTWRSNNLDKIREHYTWEGVAAQYLALFRQVMDNKKIYRPAGRTNHG